MRRISFAALIAIVAAVMPGATSAAPATEQPLLAGRTTVSGSESGFVRVHLDRPAVFDQAWTTRSRSGPTPGIRIEGGGRLVGVALMHDPPRKGRDLVFLGLRLGSCARRGCETMRPPAQVFYGDPHHERWLHLEPGPYRLYLIADGAPVSVTLELRGLDGTTQLRPHDDAGIDLKPTRPTLDLLPTRNLYSAGANYRLDTWGISVNAFVARSAASVGGETMGDCFYRGGAPPRAGAFLPPCSVPGTPLSAYRGAFAFNDPEGLHPGRMFGLINVVHGRPKGRWGYGFWFHSPTPVEVVNGMGLFIGYR